MRPEQATAAVRPEQFCGFPQRAEECFGFGDFVDCVGSAAAAEWDAVGQRVVTDLVAFLRAL